MTVAPSLDRRGAWLTVAGSALLLVGLSWWLVPWDWVPGGELTPAAATDLLSSAQIDRAEEYSSAVRRLAWASYVVSLGLALVLGLTPLGARLVARVGGRRWWLTVPAGAFVLLLAGRLATLPFALLIRERNLDYGLTRQTLGAWFVDRGTSLLVSWVVTSLLLLVVVGLARRSPRWWFAWAGGVCAALTFTLSFLYPLVVEPLFNDFTSMTEGPLRSSILRLAEEEDVHVDDVLVADASRRTTTLNAYVSGLGSSRRVVVYDNLLEQTTPRQVESVVAHELGHAKHQDVLLGTTLGAVAAVFGIALLALLLDTRWLRRRAGVDGPHDPRCVALVLALVAAGGVLASPAENTVSRAIEARADRAALSATQDPQSFLEVQRELATHSLADPTPPAWSQFWFGSHPTLVQRAGLPASLERASQ